jgi:transcriptional regulator NrdR family protein
MICPKCSADTKVKDSRPHREDARVIVRRRECDGCGHRFNTQEGTIDIVRQRQSGTRRMKRHKASWTAEQRKRCREAPTMREYARQEAEAANRPVEEILREWGLPTLIPRRSSHLNP